MDGGEFVCEWLVAIKWDILVSVSGFAIDVKVQGAIAISDDGDVEHGDASFGFFFHRPLDAGMDGVEMREKWFNEVVVDSCEGVVGLSQPEEDDIFGSDARVTGLEVTYGF